MNDKARKKIDRCFKLLDESTQKTIGQIEVIKDYDIIKVYSLNKKGEREQYFYNTKLVYLVDKIGLLCYMSVDAQNRCYLFIFIKNGV